MPKHHHVQTEQTTQDQARVIGDWYDDTTEAARCFHDHTAVSSFQMALLYRRVCAIKGLTGLVTGSDGGELNNADLQPGELPRPVLHPQDRGYLLFAISEMADACIWEMEEMHSHGRRGFEASEVRK